MDPARFTKRDESDQMDKHRKQEQARYLHAGLSQGTVAADLLLCMRAKDEVLFAEQVLGKNSRKSALCLLQRRRKKSVCLRLPRTRTRRHPRKRPRFRA